MADCFYSDEECQKSLDLITLLLTDKVGISSESYNLMSDICAIDNNPWFVERINKFVLGKDGRYYYTE